MLKSLLDEESVKTIVPGHQSLMSVEDLKKMHDYIQMLWEEVPKLHEQNFALKEIQARLELEKHFTYLKTFPFFNSAKSVHEKNIENLYYSEIPSGGAKLKKQISQNGIRQALNYFASGKPDANKCYWAEDELRDLGYDCLMFGHFEEAAGVMRLNAEHHPASWNVWDSLAEAYMNYGQSELAVRCYRKSLKLNPENDNAKNMLKKLTKD